MKDYFEINQSLWDQKTPIHASSDFYDLEGFKQGKESLNNIELEALLPVAGKSLLHLQCHFGQDTLSWARKGAKVTGIDLSPKSIELAQSLAGELALEARFIQTNIFDIREVLDEQFDIVFTSYGVLGWLPDLEAWAQIVYDFLKPGGTFFIVEFHPVLYMFDFGTQELAYHYFNIDGAQEETVTGTYAVPEAGTQHQEVFWQHSLDEVLQPLLNQGLQLSRFKEYDYSPYNCFENMQEREAGKFVFGKEQVRWPHLFSLQMKKL